TSGGLALDDRLHALERGAYVAVVRLAPEAAEQRPVHAAADVVGQAEILSDVGAAVGGLQAVTPRVHGTLAPHHHAELEMALGFEDGDLALRPVRRALLVALHVAPEPRTLCRAGGATGPFGVEGLGAELANSCDVGDQVPDPVDRCVHVDGDLASHRRAR